ncbi:MAG: hypothetical protein RL670_765 [Actinomycetota bacterium]
MDFSGLGGVTVAIVAALWLLVVLPDWVNGYSRKNEKPISKPRQVTAPKPSSISSTQSARLRKTQRTTGALSLLATFASGCTLAVGTAIGSTHLLWLLLELPLAITFGLANRQARARLFEPVIDSKPVTRPMLRPTVKVEVQRTQAEPETIFSRRAWAPAQLPNPLTNRLGVLRDQAPVVSFETARAARVTTQATAVEEKNQPANEIDINEILKRRRAI